MTNAKVLYDHKVVILADRYEARILAYEVTNNKKFPDGVKLSCVLLDVEEKVPRLLLDNHEPYGYHLHTKMPHDKSHRVQVDVKNYIEAIEFFLREAFKVVENEK